MQIVVTMSEHGATVERGSKTVACNRFSATFSALAGMLGTSGRHEFDDADVSPNDAVGYAVATWFK